MQDSPPTPDTYRVDVESLWVFPVYSGLTSSQRSLQYVVSGIDWCFTSRVLKLKVDISESIGLRKHTKEQHWINIKN